MRDAEMAPEVDELIVERLSKPFFQDDLAKALSRTGKRGDRVVTLSKLTVERLW